MKQNASFIQSWIAISKRALDHVAIISFVLAMLTLIYCVFSIQQVFNIASDQTYRDSQIQKNTKTSFDRKTIEQVRSLRTTNDSSIALPDGKLNPFIGSPIP